MDIDMQPDHAAYVAGLFDGEASIGLNRQGKSYRAVVQVSMTHRGTIDHVISLLEKYDLQPKGHGQYAEKGDEHRPAYRLVIARITDIGWLGSQLLPYSVTKRRHWELLVEFCQRRAVHHGVDMVPGVDLRGGHTSHGGFDDRDEDIFNNLRMLNRKGIGQPLQDMVWVDPQELTGNNWNPNRVLKAEWRILKRNLEAIGWVQPILARPGGEIIDGFHRWQIAKDHPEVTADGLIPVCYLDVDDQTARILTVRMNRAKGVHQASAVADIVKHLTGEGYDRKAVAAELGMSTKELDLMLAESVFEARNIKDWKYSPAWYPVEE